MGELDGVVSMGSYVAGSAPWATSTVSAKFSLNGCNSTLGPPRSVATLSLSVIRPISTMSIGVRRVYGLGFWVKG